MTSFILTAQSKEKRKQYILEFMQKHNIDILDLTTIEKDENSKNLQSLGIQDVKTLQKKLYLKPLKSKEKVLVLDDAQLLTIEAQNALLKMLEEPPENTYIFLSSETTDVFVETILSRCQIIELEQAQQSLDSDEEKELMIFLNKLANMQVGDRLKKAELISKNKDEAIIWLEKLTLTARQQLLKSPNAKRAQTYASLIIKFQKTHTQLKTTNINVRFAIESMLLAI